MVPNSVNGGSIGLRAKCVCNSSDMVTICRKMKTKFEMR